LNAAKYSPADSRIVARNWRERSAGVLVIRMPVVPKIAAKRQPVMAHG
jgi:hypothetical protein